MWLLQSNYVLSSEIDLLQSLKQNQHVEIAQFNHILESRKSPNDPLYRDQWYHRNFVTQGHDMSSEQAWEVSTGGITEDGDTIVTCVIDGGIDITHEDLSPVIWKNYNEVPNNKIDDDQNGYIDDFLGWNTFNQSDVFVVDYHGTAVAGIAASKGNNSKGISSLSWDSKLVFVSGGSDEANAIESYTYPWTLRRMYNNSNGKRAFIVTAKSFLGRNFGRPEESPLWCAIYDSLGKVGILSVAATANGDINVDVEGDLPTSCISPYLVTVTNIDQDNHKVSDAALWPIIN
ncbi:MAG: S8 family serine peptidase [Saprospiraceae bacterium]|nr:S8 family serine peptidase [Saprospiraceae bacterium]